MSSLYESIEYNFVFDKIKFENLCELVLANYRIHDQQKIILRIKIS